MALFVERAAAVAPGFALTTANAPTVAAICARLDGLPLALELAAARSDLLSPRALLARLTARPGAGRNPDPLALLVDGPVDLPGRQRTLRDAIMWSYDLLGAAERSIFRRLAPFAGGASLEAIEAVCAVAESVAPVPPATLVGLGGLVRASLVGRTDGPDGEPRFLLLETLRAFAQEQLAASGEEDGTRERHAAYYLALAEEAEPLLRGPQQRPWLARLERERDNLRAALSWALANEDPTIGLRLAGALWWYWHARNHLGEGRRWLEAALAHRGKGSARLRAKALTGAGALATWQGDLPQALVWLELGLASWRELADRANIADTLNHLGRAARVRGDHARAASYYLESLALRRALGHRRGIADTTNNLGIVLLLQGDLGQARAFLEESLALHRALSNTYGIGASLNQLCRVAVERGDYAQATCYLLEGLSITQELDFQMGIAECLEDAARLASAQGQPLDAARLYGAADALRRTIHTPLAPGDRPIHERHVAASRGGCDGAAWLAAWQTGCAMSLHEAIARARAIAESGSGLAVPPAPPARAESFAGLTPREREVAALVARGLTNKQIAAALIIGTRSVDSHVAHILRKLGLATRAQIAAWITERTGS